MSFIQADKFLKKDLFQVQADTPAHYWNFTESVVIIP